MTIRDLCIRFGAVRFSPKRTPPERGFNTSPYKALASQRSHQKSAAHRWRDHFVASHSLSPPPKLNYFAANHRMLDTETAHFQCLRRRRKNQCARARSPSTAPLRAPKSRAVFRAQCGRFSRRIDFSVVRMRRCAQSQYALTIFS